MKEEKYILVMFPYPSGAGLHCGHSYNYAIMDSYARYQKYKGIDVFQPFGYDAFGLPAENYAKKVGRDPREVTEENIENFREEMDRMNTNYTEHFSTTDPAYMKWTQWLFTELYNRGLAYKKEAPVNHCSSCETVLANEQVIDDRCERCGTKVEEKVLNQWFFKISDYKQRLIDGLETSGLPEKTQKQQRHWLEDEKFDNDWCVSRQRSWGCPIPIEGETDTLDTFVDSSFYYLRYCDPNNDEELCAFDKVKQIDLYVGGNEHACMHLIYARFINMFLYDIGVTPFEVPWKKVIHQGMITKDGEKMSKSKGNVISPKDYDSDELRLYLMQIGPYEQGGDWNDKAIKGVRKFITWFKKWCVENYDENIINDKINNNIHDNYIDMDQFEHGINFRVEHFKVNNIVSDFMGFRKKNQQKKINSATRNRLVELFKCFAPGFEY